MTLRAAALETESNRRLMAGMANATLTFGATSINGLFQDGFVDSFGSVQSEKRFTCLTASTTGMAYGSTVSIGGTSYTVAELHPDGTGMTQVMLK